MKVSKSIIIFSILLLSGCTAVLWGGNKVATPRIEQQTLIQDNVTAVFQYENLAASAIQNKQKISLNIPPEGVAFMGEKNIYILTSGATELLSLNKLATRIPLISQREENTLKFRLTESSKDDVIPRFSETLPVVVNQPTSKLSEDDINFLRQAGFVDDGKRYVRNVYVGGVIIPKASLDYSPENIGSLGRKYKVEFYSLNGATDFHPENLVTNIVFTPLALAADIVFFPISISMLQLINGS